MIDVQVAVGVGYEFAIVSSDAVRHIQLKNTHQLVSVNREVYPLYKGETYEDSRKIDAVMDGTLNPMIYKIDSHLVN